LQDSSLVIALIASLSVILSGVAGYVAAQLAARGQRVRTDAKIESTKADTRAATSDLEVRTDKLRQEALELSLRRADKVEEKFEVTRQELVVAGKERANVDGQLRVMQQNQSESNLQIQSLTLALGEQKALTVLATQSNEKYQARIEALEAEVAELKKQVLGLTKAVAEANAEREQMRLERDAALKQVADAKAAPAATPLQVAPAGATP
jgi:chromosome segregation ATPase